MASRHIFNTDIISGNILWIDSVQSTGNIIEANCNFNVKDDLNVGKNTYLSGTVHVDRDAVLKSNLYLEDDLNVGKNTYLSGTVHVDQDAVLKSNLYLEDDLNVGKNTHLSGTVHVDQDAVLKSNLYLEDDLNVGKNTHLSGAIHVDRDAVLKSGLFVEGDARIDGNLYVSGDQVIMETATVRVEDKNIELAVLDSASDITADGGGLTLKGSTDKTILWNNSTDSWDFSEHVGVADGKYIFSDKLRARDSAGLSLEDDNGNGIFIEDGGNVGIGTSGPNDRLHVAGGMLFNNYNVIKWKDSQGSKRNVLVLDSNDDFSIINNTTGDGGAVLFKTKAGAVESARIDSAGNVGIGTTSPISPLTVQGQNDTTFDNIGNVTFLGTDAYNSNAGAGIIFGGRYNSGNDVTTFGQISSIKENNTDGDYKGTLTFGTRDGSTSTMEKMRINSSGNVGIGTTNPGALLDVSLSSNSLVTSKFYNGGGSAPATVHVVDEGDAVDHVGLFVGSDDLSSAVLITKSDKVGIGTANPASKLEVYSNSGTGNTQFHLHNDSAGNAAVLRLEGGRDATNSTIYQDVGQLLFANKGNVTAGIRSHHQGDGESSNNDFDDGDLRFYTSDYGSLNVLQTRMTIAKSGNVGIGTTNPSGKLHIEGNSLIVNTENSAEGKSIYFRWSDGAAINSDSYLTFGTSSIPTERMRIDSAGNVGIGTTSPSVKLEVLGASSTISYDSEIISVQTATADHRLAFGVNSNDEYAWIRSCKNGTELPLLLNGLGGNVGIGTTSPNEKLDLNGILYLRNSTAPTTTTNRLYAAGGNLFWNGQNVLDNVDTWRPISSAPTNGAATTSISSDWAFDNVKTAVPVNAVFTDTNTHRAIDDSPTNGATTTSISSNWAFDNVKTAVPVNAVFTDTNTHRAIDDSPTNGATTTSISSNWAFDNVKTAVPVNAVFTDTVPTFSYNSTTKTLTITT